MKRWHLTEQPFTDGLTQAVFEYRSAKGDHVTLAGYSAHPPFARTDLAEALDDLAQAAGEAARELRGVSILNEMTNLRDENKRLKDEIDKASSTFATLCNDVSGSSASALEERARLVDGWNTERELHDKTREQLHGSQERIDELEANPARAVEALERIVVAGSAPSLADWQNASTVLQALKGSS